MTHRSAMPMLTMLRRGGFVILAVAFFVASCLAIAQRGPWYDEFYSFYLARPGATLGVLGPAWLRDNHPPLFYGLVWGWARSLGLGGLGGPPALGRARGVHPDHLHRRASVDCPVHPRWGLGGVLGEADNVGLLVSASDEYLGVLGSCEDLDRLYCHSRYLNLLFYVNRYRRHYFGVKIFQKFLDLEKFS